MLMKESKLSDDAKQVDTMARLTTIGAVGTEMVAPIGLGWLLDYWLGTMPWFMVGMAVLGFVGGVFHLIQLNKPRDSK